MTKLSDAGKFWLCYLIFLGGLIFFIADAIGNPYLTCDTQDNVGWYEIDGLGVDGTHIPFTPSGAQMYLKHDLAGLSVGTPYDITVCACNVWGCSDSVPFSFTPESAPNLPAGLGLLP